MSQFDFVSVFFSIVFGLGLSQLLIGLMNDVTRRKVTEQQWVYSAFALTNVLHYAGLAGLALYVRNPVFQRLVAWYFLLSILVWSFVVRRFV